MTRYGNFRRWVMVLAVVVSGLMPGAGAVAANSVALWDALRSGGHVALIRHALAPGTGDPADFAIGDCATQRILSEEGRAQARRIGALFRANGIETAPVYTSQWCRCRDTAALLGLGPVADLPVLNSFFGRPGGRMPQTEGLRQWIAAQTLDSPRILVTHQVNITAITGVYPSSGEIVIVRAMADGDLAVVGTIRTD